MRLLSVLGITFSIVAIIASMGMNYAFMADQGKTVLEGQILGWLSVSFDGLKSLLPIFIAAAYAGGKYFKATIGSVLFVLLIGFALLSAIGFAAGNRGAVTGGREATTQKYELTKQELRDAESRLAQIRTKRSPGTIKADMAAQRQGKRWRSTKGCTDTTAKLSIKFCKNYFGLQAEHQDAVEAVKLRETLSQLRPAVSQLRAQGAGRPADPQAGIIARFIPGFEISDVQTALSVFIALLVEMVAAFGLYLSSGHSFVRQVEKKPENDEEKEETEQFVMKLPVIQERPKSPKQLQLVSSQDFISEAQPERFSLRKGKALISSQ